MENNLIKCPKCGTEFELTRAITGNIELNLKQKFESEYQTKLKLNEDKIKQAAQKEIEEKYAIDIKDLKSQVDEKDKKIKEIDKRDLELRKKEREISEKESALQKAFDDKLKIEKEKIEKQAFEDAKKQSSTEFDDMKNQISELKDRLSSSHKKELELLKKQRELQTEREEFELEIEKKLQTEKDKLYKTAKEKSDSENSMKIREKEETIKSMQKTIEELKEKSERGSQQLRGEVQELEIEDFLKLKFPLDNIQPVPKGKRGADVIQTVKNSLGKECGTIIWESKRTKSWSDSWIKKLKEDQRDAKADVPVIVTQSLPEDITTLGQKDNVWIVGYNSTLGIAIALRDQLIKIKQMQASEVGKNQKMETLYQYLCSNDFRQRIEAIVESFTSMKEDLESEKRLFEKQWAKREKQITNVVKNTSGMYGDLQALIGAALPEVKLLEIESKPKTIKGK